jgi:peptide/nickel transport system permease protein
MNRLALGSLIFIGFSFLIAISGYLISPDHTPMANRQNLLISMKKPGFKVKVIHIPDPDIDQRKGLIHRIIFGHHDPYKEIPVSQYWFAEKYIYIREYNRDSTAAQILKYELYDLLYPGSSLLLFDKLSGKIQIKTNTGEIILASIAELQSETESSLLKERHFFLGTDRYGRDVLSQLLIGTRVSLSVGLISVIISLVIGITFGSIAGYYGGWVDSFIMWVINVIWAVPTLLLVIAITFALGKGFWQVFIAVGLTMWIEVARVVRGQFLSLREKEFVEASRALGFSNLRIILLHVLPNALAPVIVISAANFASAILLEAGLSFLGIGVQPPMPSWGTMIRENYAFIILDFAYLAILPGIAIMIMVLAFMIAGNGLRDALDVKTIE